MIENKELHEKLDKQISQNSDKKIDTFDDLKVTQKADRIETFDEISQRKSEIPRETFDDFRNVKESVIKFNFKKSKDTSEKDIPELSEQKKMQNAVDSIKKIEWMEPEKWKLLGNDEDGIRKKRIALEGVGKALRDAYHTPDPPIMISKMEPTNLLGEYGDGYKYDPRRDKYEGKIEISPFDFKGHGIVGSDYGIKMNEIGFHPKKMEKLFGDDPIIALSTYCHEFRHSYQCEQAHAYEQGFSVVDGNKAKEWSENLMDIKYPPEDELKENNPERYFEEFKAYRNQPIEMDAREFGEKLSNHIYKKAMKS